MPWSTTSIIGDFIGCLEHFISTAWDLDHSVCQFDGQLGAQPFSIIFVADLDGPDASHGLEVIFDRCPVLLPRLGLRLAAD